MPWSQSGMARSMNVGPPGSVRRPASSPAGTTSTSGSVLPSRTSTARVVAIGLFEWTAMIERFSGEMASYTSSS